MFSRFLIAALAPVLRCYEGILVKLYWPRGVHHCRPQVLVDVLVYLFLRPTAAGFLSAQIGYLVAQLLGLDVRVLDFNILRIILEIMSHFISPGTLVYIGYQ